MLFHRFGTLSHILASTELNCFSRKNEILSDEALIEKNAVAIVKVRICASYFIKQLILVLIHYSSEDEFRNLYDMFFQ